mgnify:CR=1 FL=1
MLCLCIQEAYHEKEEHICLYILQEKVKKKEYDTGKAKKK